MITDSRSFNEAWDRDLDRAIEDHFKEEEELSQKGTKTSEVRNE